MQPDGLTGSRTALRMYVRSVLSLGYNDFSLGCTVSFVLMDHTGLGLSNPQVHNNF